MSGVKVNMYRLAVEKNANGKMMFTTETVYDITSYFAEEVDSEGECVHLYAVAKDWILKNSAWIENVGINYVTEEIYPVGVKTDRTFFQKVEINTKVIKQYLKELEDLLYNVEWYCQGVSNGIFDKSNLKEALKAIKDIEHKSSDDYMGLAEGMQHHSYAVAISNVKALIEKEMYNSKHD